MRNFQNFPETAEVEADEGPEKKIVSSPVRMRCHEVVPLLLSMRSVDEAAFRVKGLSFPTVGVVFSSTPPFHFGGTPRATNKGETKAKESFSPLAEICPAAVYRLSLLGE